MIPLRDLSRANRRSLVTPIIVIVCSAVFIWQSMLGDEAARWAVFAFGMIPGVVLGQLQLADGIAVVPAVATIVTSMFLHADVIHLLGNMIFLWIFGRKIEDELGPLWFALFYLTCGVAAAISQIIPQPYSPTPMIGASGAISGILGAYMILFPRARIMVFIPISCFFFHEVRAGWLLGIWFLLQFILAFISSEGAVGVAWWAHIGGFIAGMILALFVKIRRPRPRSGPWG